MTCSIKSLHRPCNRDLRRHPPQASGSDTVDCVAIPRSSAARLRQASSLAGGLLLLVIVHWHILAVQLLVLFHGSLVFFVLLLVLLLIGLLFLLREGFPLGTSCLADFSHLVALRKGLDDRVAILGEEYTVGTAPWPLRGVGVLHLLTLYLFVFALASDLLLHTPGLLESLQVLLVLLLDGVVLLLVDGFLSIAKLLPTLAAKL
mmetsp:Transcript_38021/g.77813  ORF Transcript_38021/g.77813 Transcript_38021/m.77813 type:complete len:204 (-) Transcript_38021:176-787(-)